MFNAVCKTEWHQRSRTLQTYHSKYTELHRLFAVKYKKLFSSVCSQFVWCLPSVLYRQNNDHYRTKSVWVETKWTFILERSLRNLHVMRWNVLFKKPRKRSVLMDNLIYDLYLKAFLLSGYLGNGEKHYKLFMYSDEFLNQSFPQSKFSNLLL